MKKENRTPIHPRLRQRKQTSSLRKWGPWIALGLSVLIGIAWNAGYLNGIFDEKNEAVEKYKEALKDPQRYMTMQMDNFKKEMENIEDPFVLNTPEKVPGLPPVKQVCSNGYSTTVLTAEGQVIQFGIGQENYRTVPFPSSSSIQSVHCGDYFSFALTTEGKLYSWGRQNSPLGYFVPEGADSQRPHLLSSLLHVKKLATGQNHVLALTEDGKVYSWGEDNQAETGIKVGKKTLKPTLLSFEDVGKVADVSAGGFHSLILSEEGKVYYFGQHLNERGIDTSSIVPLPIRPQESFIDIHCGGDHLFIRSKGNKFYSWGWAEKGQLGFNTTEKVVLEPTEISTLNNVSVKKIVGGKHGHSLALLENGTVMGFGWNEQGQLGLQDKNDQFEPQLIGNLESIVQVDGGYKHSVALNDKGEVFTFGENVYGQLGQRS